MCSFDSCAFPLFDRETCMEWKEVSFSKYYVILSIFKWIFCTLKIIENQHI